MSLSTDIILIVLFEVRARAPISDGCFRFIQQLFAVF